MSKEHATYELIGFVNISGFKSFPSFLEPVFECTSNGHSGNYYTQEGNILNLTLSGFRALSKDWNNKIILFNNLNSNFPKNIAFSLVSEPLFAFRVTETFVYVGTYSYFKDFFRSFRTNDPIIRKSINYFLEARTA